MQDELLMIILTIGLIWIILYITALRKSFEKAWEAGRKAIIPIYNTYIVYKIANIKIWFRLSLIIWFLLGILTALYPQHEELITSISSFLSGIVWIVAYFLFARKYNRWIFASILFIVFFPICILILWLWDSKYNKKHKNSANEILPVIILSIVICIFLVFITWKYSNQDSKRVLSDKQEILIDTDWNSIDELILWKWVHWWMTLDEIKKIYWLNNRNITEWFWWAEQYMDLSKYKKISFINNKWIQIEFRFYYYDNNYRLYKVSNKYSYSVGSYNNAKNFLDTKFWTTKEKDLKGCITCKEWFRYNRWWTSAYLLKDYGQNYLDLKDIIDNFQIQYESDSIVNIINSDW
jgi:hypothetical protein